MNNFPNNTVLMKGKVDTFTATSIRVKAFTTGQIPNFINLLDNLLASRLEQDNLIH